MGHKSMVGRAMQHHTVIGGLTGSEDGILQPPPLPPKKKNGKIVIFMSSLCGVGVRVSVNNFSSKTTRPRDVLFFFKRYLIYRG